MGCTKASIYLLGSRTFGFPRALWDLSKKVDTVVDITTGRISFCEGVYIQLQKIFGKCSQSKGSNQPKSLDEYSEQFKRDCRGVA